MFFFLTLFHVGSKTLDTTWGGADSARKEETRNSGCILRLREWGCHVISHLGVPDQGAYGSRPQTHPPPTPGAPKDHPSSMWGGGICQDKETRDSGWFYTTNGEFTCQLDLPSTKSLGDIATSVDSWQNLPPPRGIGLSTPYGCLYVPYGVHHMVAMEYSI